MALKRGHLRSCSDITITETLADSHVSLGETLKLSSPAELKSMWSQLRTVQGMVEFVARLE